MTEHSTPDPEPRPTGTSRVTRTLSAVGGGLGCLLFLVLAAVAAVGALGAFLDDPAFWIAFVALVVALAALDAAKRRR